MCTIAPDSTLYVLLQGINLAITSYLLYIVRKGCGGGTSESGTCFPSPFWSSKRSSLPPPPVQQDQRHRREDTPTSSVEDEIVIPMPRKTPGTVRRERNMKLQQIINLQAPANYYPGTPVPEVRHLEPGGTTPQIHI